PEGVAIDAAAGKIYWSTGGAAGTIKVGNLDGSGTPQTLFINQNNPIGVAVDPTAGKIYWVEYGTGSIRVGNIDGSGTPQTLFTGEIQPYFLALLRSPVGAGAPQISGGSTAGSTLTCSQGLWQPDLVGAFLYRAPGSFGYQWSLNGTAIAGAATSSYTTSAPGNYNCQVTGTNPAGSSSQTSAPFAVTAAVHHPAPPPTLTAVAQSHRRWREGNKLAVITRKRRPPVGTTFSFTLNEPASVSFTFSQRVTGRRVKGRCVAQTSKNRHKHACTRSLVRGALSFTGHSGLNRVTFQGRISKHKRLKPGNYTLSITATNAAGQRALAKLTFTIVS
ncbi:MAG TPA: hypothetical protein VKR21_07510, partial [Solirubrobacteraceae bacterium]|nr:hypothetical protein [Solirubrobacteraceae bacterium]